MMTLDVDYCDNPKCRNVVSGRGLCIVCMNDIREQADRMSPRTEDVWTLTYSGLNVSLLNPTPRMISIHDIAWSLSGMPRFNGHTVHGTRYTVGQHSCLAHDMVAETTDCWKHRLWALLHDASEAYLPDMHSVLKQVMTGFRGIEARFEAAIASRFGLDIPRPEIIKIIDRKLLATEKRDLMRPDDAPWFAIQGVEPYTFEIAPWSARKTHDEFLGRFISCNGAIIEGLRHGD